MSNSLNVAELIEQHADLVEMMAYKAYNKIRKPASHDVDDLKQEANAACVKAINSFDPTKNANISTWIQFIIERHLYDIVWYSYKKAVLVNVEDLRPFGGGRLGSSEKIVEFLDWLNRKFSFLEKRYIRLLLIERNREPKGCRERVCKELGISEKVEEALRNSIKEIILKRA